LLSSRIIPPKVPFLYLIIEQGFIEAEGEFYLVRKSPNRIVHGFGLGLCPYNQILDQCIRETLHISTKTKVKQNNHILETTNSRAIENVIEYFDK
jgi:hypothetical protein